MVRAPPAVRQGRRSVAAAGNGRPSDNRVETGPPGGFALRLWAQRRPIRDADSRSRRRGRRGATRWAGAAPDRDGLATGPLDRDRQRLMTGRRALLLTVDREPGDETARQERPAHENLPRVRARLPLAQEMGARLARGALLLGTLPPHGTLEGRQNRSVTGGPRRVCGPKAPPSKRAHNQGTGSRRTPSDCRRCGCSGR